MNPILVFASLLCNNTTTLSLCSFASDPFFPFPTRELLRRCLTNVCKFPISLFNSAISCLITYINSEISVDLSSNNVFRLATEIKNNSKKVEYAELIVVISHLSSLCRVQFLRRFLRIQILELFSQVCHFCHRLTKGVDGIRRVILRPLTILMRLRHGTPLFDLLPYLIQLTPAVDGWSVCCLLSVPPCSLLSQKMLTTCRFFSFGI